MIHLALLPLFVQHKIVHRSVTTSTPRLWITGFLDFVHLPVFRRTQHFENWICFRPRVRGETPSLFGPLERANLNHWTYLEYRTMDEVQNSSNPECYALSLEPFRIYG
jgi:hypothetical protein